MIRRDNSVLPIERWYCCDDGCAIERIEGITDDVWVNMEKEFFMQHWYIIKHP